VAITTRVQELARAALAVKWFAGSKVPVTSMCPFCVDAGICKDCKCPVEICTDHGNGGIFAPLHEWVISHMHDDLLPRICDAPQGLVTPIIEALEKLVSA